MVYQENQDFVSEEQVGRKQRKQSDDSSSFFLEVAGNK